MFCFRLQFTFPRCEVERLQARQAAAAAYQKSRKQRTPDDEERGGRPIITTVIGDSEVPFDRVRPTQRSIANAKLASQLEEIRAAKKAAYKQQPLAPESGGGRGPGIHHKLAVVGVTVMAVVVASILVFKLADRIFGKAKDEGKPAQKPAKRRRRRQVSSPVFRARPGNEQALFYAPRRNIFGGDAAALEDTLAQQEPLPVFGGASPESQASSGLPTENGNGMRSF